MPAIVHVTELTQPQGHSTSGSHERYKTKERLAWEAEFDCVRQFRQWIIEQGYATAETLDSMEAGRPADGGRGPQARLGSLHHPHPERAPGGGLS